MQIGSAFMLALSGAATNIPQASLQPQPVRPSTATVPYGPPAPAPARKTARSPGEGCQPKDARDIVVCAQRRQAYRLDPSIVDAERQGERIDRSATSAMPAAQASCAASPMGCGKGLESLDVANVALVVGKAAVRAAKGKDWASALRTGGPDEYQLYLQAKRQREAREEEQAAAAVVANARTKKADPSN
jgi:hypothetical protein